ncbi:p26-a [Helicoverpa armigera multiple nucleopolyhedrovirus]|uniref:p26 n=1 Tax=Mamestra brassicae nuclear polyhedrosis virus TaxID=78219 RepID=A0A077CY78_NPVMB|nr:p26-a [Helicoverpa armigera multiple nucleopolyhedrovirus]AIL25230.1 p26 [Mamestra brassicae multiple nucleopolyhedrovirus]WHN38815.1 P26-a [Mamestra brassicae multiple nucleopolyhedrovirus]
MAWQTLTLAVTLCALTAAMTTTTHNTLYSVDHVAKTMQVHEVDGNRVNITVIPPNSDTNDDESLSMYHHFPGVATQVLFPPVTSSDDLYVQLSDGVLYKTRATRVFTNFHSHKGRMVYGQLLTIAVDDFSIAGMIYVGAPIYRDKKLVSVVTCRYDDYDAQTVLFPVSGIRPRGLVSGQFNFDDRIIVQELRRGMSVYGREQLPYQSAHMSVKQFALTTNNNKQAYRDLPRAIAVFHNANEITIALVEGQFEIDRVRFDGPLITPQ